MKKEPVLKIEYERVFDKYAIRIVYQNTKILKRGQFNDYGLKSCACIAYYDNIFYVRGDYKEYDNDIILVNDKELQDILEKVYKVNEQYGIIENGRVKQYDVYYYIDSYGGISKEEDAYDWRGDDRYNLGNYFKTEKEANKVIKSNQWKKLWEDVKRNKL
jgi:putative uncharacterized protein FNV0866|nr:MAG TPA: hypothetical protein [Ackermannviridae sp.]